MRIRHNMRAQHYSSHRNIYLPVTKSATIKDLESRLVGVVDRSVAWCHCRTDLTFCPFNNARPVGENSLWRRANEAGCFRLVGMHHFMGLRGFLL